MSSSSFEPIFQSILKSKSYAQFAEKLRASNCPRCPALCAERHNIVVDRGTPKTKLVAIGEGPGENEDLQGKSFVGRGGQLFDKIMASVGIDTNADMLILNVVKCRPPKNRPPTPQEAANCTPYLEWQLKFVKPRVVILLGATAAKYFIPKEKAGKMKDLVGKLFDLPAWPNVTFMLLYHPAFLLRDPRKQPETRDHVKVLRAYLEKEGIYAGHQSSHR
jgi:DNA polymerase